MKLRIPIKSKKFFALLIVAILVISSLLFFMFFSSKNEINEISIRDVLELTSERNSIEDLVISTDEEPMFSLISTPVACWYDIGVSGDSRYGLKPFLIANDGKLEANQHRFIDSVDLNSAVLIGNVENTGGSEHNQFSGTPAQVSIPLAKYVYLDTAGVLIIEDNEAGYELGVTATPIASYLNIPVIVVDSSTDYGKLKSDLSSLGVDYTIILGENNKNIARKLDFKCILLESSDEINKNVLEVVRHRFHVINYISMTNPADVIPPYVINTNQEVFTNSINNVKIKTGTTEFDIIGESTHTQDITVPEGINRIQIYVNFTDVKSKPLDPFKQAIEIEPLIFASLYDPKTRIVAYAPSFSYDVGKTYLETQAFNLPGTYKLEIKVYYGTDGLNTYAGTEFGLSNIEGSYEVSVTTSRLSSPHLPIYPRHSMIAPYTTAAHGGIVLADPDFALTCECYLDDADGYGTGPWYEKALHEAANNRVAIVVEKLNQTIELLENYDLKEDYLNGPAWLAIIAGSNMIPQYYEPKDASWVEDPIYGTGWATDNKYNMDLELSNARVIGRNVGEVSTLIARTLFYEPYVEGHSQMIKQEYGDSEDWGANFHFLAGEMGGRTGWFFWQREFAPEVEGHGFQTEEYYQNYENDRQTMLRVGAYERANYFDLMMHGNWYWYVPELNGVDSYSTGVKVSDIIKAPDDWELGPSTYVTGSCILGRIDGISPEQSMTFAFMRAGVNAFFSASRSTGSEAKAGTIEQSLLYDDVSIGEALRLDKHENQEPAAFYVRNVFGDPAFNPYEPENGFSNQGRPILVAGQETDQPEAEEKTGKAIGTRAIKNSNPIMIEEIDEDFEKYHTYEALTKELNRMASENADIVALYSIGKTFEERDIWAMKVSDNPLEHEDEPEVLFTGAHHGKEWPSVEVPLYFLKYLVENYGKEPTDNDNDGLIDEDIFDGLDNDGDGVFDEDEEEARISWLVDNRQLWFVPMLNADGVAYAHSQVDGGETNPENLWRKNREPNLNPVTGTPYPEHFAGKEMWGTDLNRNYGFHWGEVGYQGNADPSREDYIGPVDKTDEDNDRRVNEDRMDNIDNDGDGRIDEDPRGGFSTAETQAIKILVEEHNFVIALNYHTYAEEIYWPWVWTLELTPDEDLFCSLAKEMSQFNGYGYRDMSERRQEELSRHPPVDGDSNDWMYGKHNILAYTIELGTQFIPPEEEILPMCKLHLGSNLLMAEVADDPQQRKFDIIHEPLNDTTCTKGYTVKAILNHSDTLELASQGVMVYYTVDGKNYQTIEMEPTGELNEYIAEIPGQAPGTKISYYISATDMEEHTSQLPKYAPYSQYSFSILPSKGQASTALLILHIIFIVGAIVLVIASGYYAFKYLVKGVGLNKSVQTAGIGTGMIFIGGFPLGFIIAYQVYGTPWTGIPFGWDITDNKTLVIFLYWAISLFLVRGTIMTWFSSGRGRLCPFRWLVALIGKTGLFKKKGLHDTISHNRFARLAIIGAILTVALYLVPHSLMVSPVFSIFLFALLIGIFLMPEPKRDEVKFIDTDKIEAPV